MPSKNKYKYLDFSVPAIKLDQLASEFLLNEFFAPNKKVESILGSSNPRRGAYKTIFNYS